MLGISYGELFLILGATAALIGPKDLPIIARTAGRLAGRAIGYVQLARGQFESVMQHSQAREVHKELQDTMAQLEAIRHEIRSISFMNPGPMTRRLVDNLDQTSSAGNGVPERIDTDTKSTPSLDSSASTDLTNVHSKATAFARLANSAALKAGSVEKSAEVDMLNNESLPVLPVSAQSAGLLQNRQDNNVKGSDIVLEAILEADVAHNAKDFFAQPQNQIKYE
ncbi:uncharacterized protein LOC131150659 isoform X2 [Malania oleifera]|uniref:uncharacterized protein LOC131150659 isoform X2 n=1 Tax=Malania oleifera TaxID=397392 RepID=UPI0025AE6B8D|nr:uncharacterized protein LOC131150659 isoform X2 [Malania oleifera]